MSAFLEQYEDEDGVFTELGEESWPVGALEVLILEVWWCWSGGEEEGKWEIWFGFFARGEQQM